MLTLWANKVEKRFNSLVFISNQSNWTDGTISLCFVMKVLRGWKQQLYFQIKHIYAAFILSQRQKQNKFLMGIKAGFTIFWLFSTVNNRTEIGYNTVETDK